MKIMFKVLCLSFLAVIIVKSSEENNFDGAKVNIAYIERLYGKKNLEAQEAHQKVKKAQEHLHDMMKDSYYLTTIDVCLEAMLAYVYYEKNQYSNEIEAMKAGIDSINLECPSRLCKEMREQAKEDLKKLIERYEE